MITQSKNLNLIVGGIPQVINVSQYDKGESLSFSLYNQGASFDVPTGSQVLIQGTKPDGHGFQYECAFSGSTVTATITEQMTVVAGDVVVELSIIKNSQKLGTANFILRVEECALKDSAVISDSELPLIIAVASEQVKEAEAWAKGTKNGIPVSPNDPQFENNSYYWAQVARSYVGDIGITDEEWALIEQVL